MSGGLSGWIGSVILTGERGVVWTCDLGSYGKEIVAIWRAALGRHGSICATWTTLRYNRRKPATLVFWNFACSCCVLPPLQYSTWHKCLRKQNTNMPKKKHAKSCQDTTCQTYINKHASNMAAYLLKQSQKLLTATAHAQIKNACSAPLEAFSAPNMPNHVRIPPVKQISINRHQTWQHTSWSKVKSYWQQQDMLKSQMHCSAPLEAFSAPNMPNHIRIPPVKHIWIKGIKHVSRPPKSSNHGLFQQIAPPTSGWIQMQDRGWGPARNTDLTGSRCSHRIAVEHATLISQDRGRGPARNTDLLGSRLRSGTQHWSRRIAVEVRHATLLSPDRGWGPARNTALTESQLRRRRGEGGEEGGGRQADIKSNNPHLTGGEIQSISSQRTGSYWCC